MCGTFGYELDPRKLTEEEKEEVRQQIADYRKYNHLVRDGDFYRLIARTDNAFRCAWEFVSPDKNEAMLTSVVMRQPESMFYVQRLRGFDPRKTLHRHGHRRGLLRRAADERRRQPDPRRVSRRPERREALHCKINQRTTAR